MSKAKIYVKHKDEIMLEIIRRQQLHYKDGKEFASSVNHGFILGLMWASGMYEDVPVVTGDRDTDALLEDERIAQEGK